VPKPLLLSCTGHSAQFLDLGLEAKILARNPDLIQWQDYQKYTHMTVVDVHKSLSFLISTVTGKKTEMLVCTTDVSAVFEGVACQLCVFQ